MIKKNINHRTFLIVIIAIVLLIFVVCFLFGNIFQIHDKKSGKKSFVQEMADLKLIHIDEDTSGYYTENVKTSSVVFEDKYVRIKLEQYILYDDLVLAKFKVKQISDEELIVFSGNEWNLKKNVNFDGDNCIKETGGYNITLRNQRGEYYNFYTGADSIKTSDDGLEIYMKAYILEENEGFKYIVSNGEKDVEIPLELTETTGLTVQSEKCRLIIKSHLVYAYDEPDFDKLEIEYNDGIKTVIVKDRNIYSTWSADEKNMWFYIPNENRIKTENIAKVYLDEKAYVFDKEQGIYIKEQKGR